MLKLAQAAVLLAGSLLPSAVTDQLCILNSSICIKHPCFLLPAAELGKNQMLSCQEMVFKC